MRRWAIIAALVAASPPLATAQEGREPVVGFLNSQSPASFMHLAEAFREGLGEGGYLEGTNVRVEYRWAEGQYDRLAGLAGELAAANVDVIFAGGGNPSALAARSATSNIPVVFVMGGDPVALGLVQSVNRPGGNLTGLALVTGALDQKRLELLHRLLPAIDEVTVLLNPTIANEGTDRAFLANAADALGLRLRFVTASSLPEIENAFAAMAADGTRALLIGTDPFFYSQREPIVALAALHAIPTIYTQGEYVTVGGLFSYSASLPSAYRQAGLYVARVLDGEDPGEMPIIQDAVFDFVINLRTAQALGLTVPVDLLAAATLLIE